MSSIDSSLSYGSRRLGGAKEANIGVVGEIVYPT